MKLNRHISLCGYLFIPIHVSFNCLGGNNGGNNGGYNGGNNSGNNGGNNNPYPLIILPPGYGGFGNRSTYHVIPFQITISIFIFEMIFFYCKNYYVA